MSHICAHSDAGLSCPCTYEPCPRKGKCCACLQYHWRESRELPACFFSPEAEATFDRSLKKFLETTRS